VHHVVTSIVAPFGEPIDARPPVPTEEERIQERIEKKEGKRARKAGKNLGPNSLLEGEVDGRGEEGRVRMDARLGGEEAEEKMGETSEREEGENGVWDALQQRVTEEVKAEKVRDEKKSWWR
jgi:small subunit ribosomal protein S17